MTLSIDKYGFPVITALTVLVYMVTVEKILPGYLYVILFVLPLLDKRWRIPKLLVSDGTNLSLIFGGIVICVILLVLDKDKLGYFFTMLVITAIPEEWYFRGYLLEKFGPSWSANIMTSCVFSLLHGLHQGVTMAVLVFIPSLLFGRVYQLTRNIYLCMLLHAISNLLFMMFFKDILISMYE